MAVFVHDTFTNTDGTLLSDHTGETGASWTQLLVDRPVYISANRVLYTSGTNFYYRYKASGTPSNANYSVEADIYVLSNEDYCGVLGRAVDDDNHFYTYYNSTAWVLYKRVAAVNTLLGTYTVALTVGNTYRLKLEMIGSAIKVYVDGVERISVTEPDLSNAGNAGVWGRHDATTTDGYGITEFWATDAGGTNYERTVTDGIQFFDPSSKSSSHQDRDNALLGSSYVLESARFIKLLDALILADELRREAHLYILDSLNFNIEAAGEVHERLITDTMFLVETVIKDRQLSVQDAAFLLSLVTAAKGRELSFLDEIIFRDTANFGRDLVFADQIFLFDSIFRQALLAFIDKLLFGESIRAEKLIDVRITDFLFIQTATYKAIERLLSNGLLLSDLASTLKFSGAIDLTLSDSILFGEMSALGREMTKREELILSDTHRRAADLGQTEGVLFSDGISSIGEKILTESVLFRDVGLRELLITVLDRTLFWETENFSFDRVVFDGLLFQETLSKALEIMRREEVLLYDTVAALRIEALIEALVYARLQAVNAIGAKTNCQKNFLGMQLSSVIPLGVILGHQIPKG